jgi:drug/metabolite transporter (DMT)-like permease
VITATQRREFTGYGFLSFAILFFAVNVIIARAVHADIPPLALSFWRWAIAAVIFFPFAISSLRAQWRLMLVHWKLVLLITVLLVPLGNTLVYVGLQSTTALNAGLITVARPAIILILAYFLFRGSVTRAQWLGIGIAVTGVVLVIARGNLSVLAGLDIVRGDLWIFTSTVVIAAYQAIVARGLQLFDARALLLVNMVLGAMMLAPFYAWEVSVGRSMELDWVAVGTVLYVAIFPSILSVYFISLGIARVGVARAGIYNYLQPLFVAAIAIPVLGEAPAWYHPVALALVVAGLVVSSRGPKNAA